MYVLCNFVKMFLLAFGNDVLLMKATVLGFFPLILALSAQKVLFLQFTIFKIYNQIYNKFDTKWILSLHILSRWKVACNCIIGYSREKTWEWDIWKFFLKKYLKTGIWWWVLSTQTQEFPLFKILVYVLKDCMYLRMYISIIKILLLTKTLHSF